MIDAVSDLRGITSRSESFPQMRREVTRWRASRSAEDLIVVSQLVLDTSVGGAENERFTMAGALLLSTALGHDDARQLLIDGYAKIDNWRVQECVAKAMDEYASFEGWDSSLAWIQDCVNHPTPNVRRAAVEGPRVWTSRPPFKGPGGAGAALAVFEDRRNDDSTYVRKSVGNAMRDIGKKSPAELVDRFSVWSRAGDVHLSLIHISEPTRQRQPSRMPSSA